MQKIPALILGLFFVFSVAQGKPLDWTEILTPIFGLARSALYTEGDMELLDHYCVYKRTGYFYKWELHYKAEVRCPGWTKIIGKAKNHLNPTSAERDATEDFVRKVVAAGLVTEEEALPWLM
ncbi:anti-lipopolysaccharide factor-like [Macrobrachium nipponense]|uniref:Anti-lipopolysaccharide factor 3 n=1 Tax=Macrobrachium nipponense TaxID=159736 RepID=A0A0M5M1Q3_MACNP|nr:antilipopolysaccharide factor isoform 1 [Macrobrachium nipponense]ALF02819.1 anti-lipopolysaccharide factor 3 [Macrobrachium nipponense]